MVYDRKLHDIRRSTPARVEYFTHDNNLIQEQRRS
jgi:hypothetical protein